MMPASSRMHVHARYRPRNRLSTLYIRSPVYHHCAVAVAVRTAGVAVCASARFVAGTHRGQKPRHAQVLNACDRYPAKSAVSSPVLSVNWSGSMSLLQERNASAVPSCY